MSSTEFRIDPRILQKSPTDRLETVAHLATALNLGEGLTLEYDLTKASKAERITTPHIVSIIWDLEKELYKLRYPKKTVEMILNGLGIGKRFWKALPRPLYRTDGTPLTDEEMRRLEKLLSEALEIPENKVRELILKGSIAGKMSGTAPMGKPLKIDLSKLPRTLKEAVKTLGLTNSEVRAIQWAWHLGAINVTRAQDRAKAELKRIIVEGMMNQTHPRDLARKMLYEAADEDEGFLNRDWERISLTEMNRAHSDGFLSGISSGEYVVGISHDDACQFCRRFIHHKVYRVTQDIPSDYAGLKRGSKEYEKFAEMWETHVWVGKTNVGRSLSTRKRSNGKLEDREHHDRSMPTIPLHPSCRCVWNKWLKDLNYIKGGQIEVAIDEKTRNEREEWLKKNPMPV